MNAYLENKIILTSLIQGQVKDFQGTGWTQAPN